MYDGIMQKVDNLSSSIDIIPLQDLREDHNTKRINNKHKMEQRMFRDQSLITRVQTYMHENENKVYIDVNEMADALQRRYRDYRTKKRGAFRAMVRKAYDELTAIFSRKSPARNCPAYDDDDFEDDDAEYKQNGNSSDKELIDISSDDDVSKVEAKNQEKSTTKTSETMSAQDDPAKESSSVPPTVAPQPKLVVPKTETPTKAPTNETQVTQSQVESTRKRQREKDNNGNGQISIAKKLRTHTVPVIEPKVTFSDVGGSDKVLKTVCKLLIHLKHPEIYQHLGISSPRGFLLHGPPGCGKTLLAHAVAGELNVPLLKVAGPEIVAGISGESEARIRELFEQALAIAPCVIFLDEIDVVAINRATAQKEMEKRIVAQLLSCLDDLSLKENGDKVLMIGATNRPDSLDPALRRAGRFDREICLGIPDREARAKILEVHTKKVVLAPDVSLSTIAFLTPGFVGADLVALIREAATAAVDRVFEDLNKSRQKEKVLEMITEKEDKQTEPDKEAQAFENSGSQSAANVTLETTDTLPEEAPAFSTNAVESPENAEMDVTQEHSSDLSSLLTLLRSELTLSPDRLAIVCIEHRDFEAALRVVQPSAKREGFATVPDVTWNDVGSLQDIRQELQMTILASVKHSEHFSVLGLSAASGVLLCGPPGCGKTLLAKAIANEAGINFISVKGPELLNMYVGESEKAVRQCFLRAKNSAPCVIFFDELDALCPKRTEGDNLVTSRVVNQMLTEMDGIETRQGVFLMAASNRPDIIDPAILRPGRLDKILYVGLPTASDRVDILHAVTKNGTRPKLTSDVNLNEVGYHEKCEGYTGADLAALIKEASMEALKEIIAGNGQAEVSMRHIYRAFDKVQPSVREKDIKHYEKLSKLYSIKKNSEVTPMETPLDAPVVDVVMEPMET